MNKYAFLVGVSTALQNADENECQVQRSCWSAAEVKYQDPSDWPICTSDGDCGPDFYCINYMWAYNHQTESGKGCWRKEVCTGTGSYTLFEERNIQWFCSEEQFEANKDALYPQNWKLEPLDPPYWDEFSIACKSDADCPRPDLGQVCHNLYWQATQMGENFSRGEVCYNWAKEVCPGKDFAAINYNYENTGFSYYMQYDCTSGESSASVLTVAAATLLLVFQMF